MLSPDELVKVTGVGGAVDGIVFDIPSSSKVVVAVMDSARGPVLRTVNPKALEPRSEAGPADRALRLLMRRTPSPGSGPARHANVGANGRSSGFQRGASHRTTGR
jgi:hypothetical protein